MSPKHGSFFRSESPTGAQSQSDFVLPPYASKKIDVLESKHHTGSSRKTLAAIIIDPGPRFGSILQ